MTDSSDRLQVRPIVNADLDQVIELERRCEGASHWERGSYQQLLTAGEETNLRRHCLVAELEKSLVGFAVLRVLQTGTTSEAELESIVVDQSVRRQGIGQRLLEECFHLAKVKGWATALELEVRASNHKAQRLYQRLGMVEFARRRNYYTNPDEDAVLMRINL